MRVLIVDTFYAQVVRQVYSSTPALEHAGYDEQWHALMATMFGSSDAYSHYLGAAGHPAHELIVNCAELQRAWVRDQGPSLLRRLRLRNDAIVLAQIAEFAPDVVYVQNLSALRSETLKTIRRSSLLVGQIASELPAPARVRAFDLIVTSFPHFVERIEQLGVAAAYLPLAFDPRVLDHLGPQPPLRDLVFAGSLGRGQHGGGNSLLEHAARRIPIEFWGYGEQDWPADSPIRTGYQGQCWGLEMYRVLAQARIALNRHIDVAETHANNMRLFEATGIGTLLLTDERSDLERLFEPGREVVTYGTEDELIERATELLAQPDRRAQIALRGQQRTLKDHGYATRMVELAAILERATRGG